MVIFFREIQEEILLELFPIDEGSIRMAYGYSILFLFVKLSVEITKHDQEVLHQQKLVVLIRLKFLSYLRDVTLKA
jgi:hypothetical protein